MNSIQKVIFVILSVILLVAAVSCQQEGETLPENPGTSAENQNPNTDPAGISWAEMEDRHYSGTGLCSPEELLYGEELTLLEDRIFPIYIAPAANYREFISLFKPLAAEAATGRLRDHLTLDDSRFGALFTNADTGELMLEGFAFYTPLPEGSSKGTTEGWNIVWGNGLAGKTETGVAGPSGTRASLAVTDGLIAKLEAAGFAPETTKSLSFSFVPAFMDGMVNGILFFDEERESVLVTRMGNDFGDVYYEPDGELLDIPAFARLVLERARDFYPEPAPDSPTEPGTGVNPDTGKPVIYLYPEAETRVEVKLGYPDEHFTYTFPAYNGGWRVLARPDGELTNLTDGSTHYYLFWEGDKRVDWDQTEGFVVAGGEVEAFLLEKLPLLGLTPREYNDFITYWVPKLQDAPYLLLTFAGAQYEALAPLTITPAPDAVLRVHMVYTVLDAPVDVTPQTLVPFVRSGFTVVEWGGSVNRG